tara:strand:- start:427 stop:837 length:411 start_codon:yes stop_codon:yes gene_type:complete
MAEHGTEDDIFDTSHLGLDFDEFQEFVNDHRSQQRDDDSTDLQTLYQTYVNELSLTQQEEWEADLIAEKSKESRGATLTHALQISAIMNMVSESNSSNNSTHVISSASSSTSAISIIPRLLSSSQGGNHLAGRPRK